MNRPTVSSERCCQYTCVGSLCLVRDTTVRLGQALDPKPSIFAHFGHVQLPPFSATGCFHLRSPSFSFCLMSFSSYDNTPCLLIYPSPLHCSLVSILQAWCLPSLWMSASDTATWPSSSFIALPSPRQSFTTSFILSSSSSNVSLAIFHHIIRPMVHQLHSVPPTS